MKSIRILRIVSRILLLVVAAATVPYLIFDLVMWSVIVSQIDKSILPLPYLFALTGMFGWVALIRLATLLNRPFNQIPKWVLHGVIAGIVSAAAFGLTLGSFGALALFPITASVALLLNCALVPERTSTPCKTS